MLCCAQRCTRPMGQTVCECGGRTPDRAAAPPGGRMQTPAQRSPAGRRCATSRIKPSLLGALRCSFHGLGSRCRTLAGIDVPVNPCHGGLQHVGGDLAGHCRDANARLGAWECARGCVALSCHNSARPVQRKPTQIFSPAPLAHVVFALQRPASCHGQTSRAGAASCCKALEHLRLSALCTRTRILSILRTLILRQTVIPVIHLPPLHLHTLR